jgi:glycosyltransferase involved in cell wall biosynthesis
MSSERENILVSVVIPAHNSERTLGECLKSIEEQTHHNVEIIIVDSHSEDNTCRIAEEHGARVFQLEGMANRKRNYGVAQAEGEYILTLDSDMVMTPKVIEECLDKCLSESVEVLGISEGSIALNFWAECIALGRGIFEGSDIILPRFFRRSVFEKVKFDEELFFGDDFVLYLDLTKEGYKISKTGAKVMHYEPVKLRAMARKYYKYGKSKNIMQRKYGSSFLTIATWNLKSTARRWGFSGQFLRYPTHFFGLLFIKAIRLTAIVTGFLAGSMSRQFRSH